MDDAIKKEIWGKSIQKYNFIFLLFIDFRTNAINLLLVDKIMLYVTYLDKSIYTEKDFDWNNLPQMPILTMGYRMKNNRTFVISGFEKYIWIKEYYAFIMGANGQCLDTIHLLGKHENKVYQFSYNVRKGMALQREGVWNKSDFATMQWNSKTKQFIYGTPQKSNQKLWKRGLKGQPKAQII